MGGGGGNGYFDGIGRYYRTPPRGGSVLPGIIIVVVLFLAASILQFAHPSQVSSPSTTKKKESTSSSTGRSGSSRTNTSKNSKLSGIEFMRHVHLSRYPVQEAGLWVKRPPHSHSPYYHYSPEHMECLDNERQGNCHNETANYLSDDVEAKSSRPDLIRNHNSSIQNSVEILEGYDPYVWVSDRDEYRTTSTTTTLNYLDGDDGDFDDVPFFRTRTLIENRTIYLVGDSVMRQWAAVLHCECIHVHNMTEQQAETSIRFLRSTHTLDLQNDEGTIEFFRHVRPQDYLIFNFGLHLSKYLVGYEVVDWEENYRSVLRDAIVSMATVPVVDDDDNDDGIRRRENKKKDRHRHRRHLRNDTRQQSPDQRQQRQREVTRKANVKRKMKDTKSKLKAIADVLVPSHILFQTTTVRYFHRGMGDYNTVNAIAGEYEPRNNATWEMYGGNGPAQPIQNLLAFEVLSNQQPYGGKSPQKHQPDFNGGSGRDDNDERGSWEEPNTHGAAGLAVEGDSDSIPGTGTTTRKKPTPSTVSASANGTLIVGGVLDTATIMLARGDASFDGVHFCLPGPIQEWSKMLFYRISKNDELERRKNEDGR
jgi:hypothetical protein